MLRLTKIFYFETAHAIYGYEGKCKNIHGHSYKLEVTVATTSSGEDYIPSPGFIIDFKDLKQIVRSTIVDHFDHKLILSEQYLKANPGIEKQDSLVIWNVEPTAENILVYIKKHIEKELPANTNLACLRLYETESSYAEWVS
ncbi:MAG: 6-carboxytetrahydropterin synthase [Sphingobacteriia bacterium]|nr:6-carboxytetrahydropterin synthase [Sphingobacteriia bacterium]